MSTIRFENTIGERSGVRLGAASSYGLLMLGNGVQVAVHGIVNSFRSQCPGTTCLRDVVNVIFYVSRDGIAWRMLSKDFPVYQTVYHFFRFWSKDGTWELVHKALRDRVR